MTGLALVPTPRETLEDDELDVFRSPLDGVRLIEASAGTGKTWAICGLVLRLLLERGLTVQQVLVVTFTEAATAELRERIRSRLAEVQAALRPEAPRADDAFVVGLLARLHGELGLDDAMLRQRLERALANFDEAAVFTIHGFCQRALADAPFSAGLPMQQEVLQDDSALRDAAVKQAWREEISQRTLPPALAALLLARRDTPQAWSALLRRLLARPLAQRRWPARLAAADALPEVDLSALRRAHAEAAAVWAAERAHVVDRLDRALAAGVLKATSYKPDGLARGAAAWDALLAGDDPLAPWSDDEDKARLYTRDRLTTGSKAGKSPPEHAFFDAADRLTSLRDEAELGLGRARAWLLRRVLERAEAALRQHKQTQGLVAFDDMLFNLHQRLHDPASPRRAQALAATLRARYPAALIDEFQDTDPLQFAIFRRLYRPADEAPPPDTTLFLVGDPKQAIYSFRNADLPTYLAARSLADARYRLAHNQRSSPALIDALNRLYTRQARAFMLPGLGYQRVAVGHKPRSVLVDRSLPGDPARRAALQLWQIPPDPADGQPPLRASAQALALDATANEIARLLGEARHARITLGGHPLRAGDIAVLVRSHRQGGEVREALAARGIGSVELSQASVYRSPDAEALAWVLTAVLQPARERTLRAALATELFGRQAADLDAAAADPAGLMPEMLRFSAYRDTWQQRGIAVMLRQMMAGEGLAARLLRLPIGERRLTNWLHLSECLHQAEAAHRAPAALLRWFEQQRSDEAVTEASQLRLESDQNLVQIVTIHKSKGLEYPLVFCPFLWTPSPAAPPGNDLLAHAEPGDGASTVVLDFRAGLDDDCDPKALRQRAALDTAAEDLRLIYVALTRAVHRCMLVVGNSARAVRGGRHSVAGSHTPLNWLVAGGSGEPADWLTAKPPQTTPEQVDAAWRALALDTPPQADAPGPRPIALLDLQDLATRRADDHRPAADDAGVVLQALPPPARLPAGWAIGSYSQLSRGSLAGRAAGDAPDGAAVDHDALTADDAMAAPDDIDAEPGEAPGQASYPAALAPDDILRFPRGASAGDCIHRVFEHADFTDPTRWPRVVAAALAGLPPADDGAGPPLAPMLLRLLRDVCRTPLPTGGAPLTLAHVTPQRRLNELAFHLPAPALGAEAMNATLARLGYPVPVLGFGRLQGYLRGFIDLVVEHDGRYYVVDWKSNHLGPTAGDYTPATCARAMAHHGYHLQALVYALALERLLRLRIAGYRHDRHFGGVFYLFVRGVRPGWHAADGTPCGVHLDRPSADTLQQFAALFDAPAPTP